MSVSHEGIYTWLYALPKRAGASELRAADRRTRRQPRAGPGQRRPIVGMDVDIAAPGRGRRPQGTGHWEGDLVIGKAGKTAMGHWWSARAVTLSLSRCRTAGTSARSARALSSPYGYARKSAQVDHLGPGIEMAQHAALTWTDIRCISRTRTRHERGTTRKHKRAGCESTSRKALNHRDIRYCRSWPTR